MKNTSLGRKASNNMKAGEGKYLPKTAKNQQGDGADFAFNGQMGDGVNRSEKTHRLAGNQTGLTARENYGHKTFKGNESDCHTDRMERIGPSATRDGEKMTIATAKQGHNVGRESGLKRFPNPDAINVGNK